MWHCENIQPHNDVIIITHHVFPKINMAAHATFEFVKKLIAETKPPVFKTGESLKQFVTNINS